MDSVIKNGTVVTAAGISRADVGVERSKIAAIATDLDAAGARVIDAAACSAGCRWDRARSSAGG